MALGTIRVFGMLLFTMLVVPGLFAQSSTTGSLTGKVVDANGALPGATVQITSASAMGTKVAVSEAAGTYRFSQLAPGDYTLEVSLAGFRTVKQEKINVGLGRTVTLEVKMTPSKISEEMTVVAAAPIIDTTTASTGANVTSEFFDSLPIARDFYAIAQVAPGTNKDAAGTMFYGSTGAENQYIIDGLNTTGIFVGLGSKALNFDFIQEVEVKTGGLPAEYGRITGGIINAITKSGGNELTGDVFGYTQGGGLQSDNTTAPDLPATWTTIYEVDQQQDYGFDLGGYLIKDRIWFFGAYDRVDQTATATRINGDLVIPGQPTIPEGTVFENDVTRDLFAAKLTFQINRNNQLALSVFGDPTTENGVMLEIAGPPSTYLGTNESGGTDYIARYNGLFAASWIVSASAGQHNQEYKVSGPGASIPRTVDLTVVPPVTSGGFGGFANQEFTRDVYKLDVDKYLAHHDIKIGGDFEDITAVRDAWLNVILILRGLPGRPDLIYYNHIFRVDDLAPGFDRDDPTTWVIAAPLRSIPHTENTSAYMQDSWRIMPNFTVNAGLRWEQQKVYDRLGGVAIHLDDNWAPRLGFVWDAANNGRSKLYANYGRFYESIPLLINIAAFGGELNCNCYNTSPNPANYQPDPSVRNPFIFGGGLPPVDPNLKGQYITEMLVGYEHEVGSNFVLGIKGTYRDLGEVIEDMETDTGYFFANPGKGVGANTLFFDGTVAPAPRARREYKGLELSAHKRFSDNYQMFTSYVWSRMEGNYDGLFQASTRQLSPNWNSGYDYADFSVNNDGLLTNDREHQFKLDASYTFGDRGILEGLTVGLSTHYYSGTPLTAQGVSFAYGNWEYYLTERGALGRGPADYEADVHAGYPVKFGNVKVNLMLDIFNVLDRQAATEVDQRYNLFSDGPCAGIPEDLCNGDGGILAISGTTDPAGSISNPRATATNPDFLKAGTAFTAPRNIRLGVRMSF